LVTVLMVQVVNASGVTLDAGDTITLKANVQTTVTCGGSANEGQNVVAKVCKCDQHVISYDAIMTLVYSDGTKKSLVIQTFTGTGSATLKNCEQFVANNCN
jgi:hypothetical protein